MDISFSKRCNSYSVKKEYSNSLCNNWSRNKYPYAEKNHTSHNTQTLANMDHRVKVKSCNYKISSRICRIKSWLPGIGKDFLDTTANTMYYRKK